MQFKQRICLQLKEQCFITPVILVYAHVEEMDFPVLQRVVAVIGNGAKTP